MALENIIKEDKIEITDTNRGWSNINVRTATIITDDGTELSRSFHRHVVSPNDDVSGESDEIKKLAEIYFTDDAKAKHKAFLDSRTGPEF